jgi:hypothetical protein
MARRRTSPDPFETSSQPRWLVIRDLMSRPVRYAELASGADLRAAMVAERERMMADGWVVDEVRRYSFVFATRGNDRWCVTVECFEPGTAPIAHGSFIGRAPQK